MLLGGNIILLGDNSLDELASELREKERICFVGELPKHIVAIMGFNAYTVGLVTIMHGDDKTEARRIYQQIVELFGKLTHDEVKLPVTPYAGLVWIEQVHKTTFTCGVVFGKDQDFSIFHTDVMDGADDAIGALKEILADEVRSGKEPIIKIITEEDWEEFDRVETEQV